MKSKSIKTIFAALLLSAALMSNAQDKATLDLLVSKGLISREEADKVSKGTTMVVAKEKATSKLTFSGRIQEQYQWINSQAVSPSEKHAVSKNGFQMRRLYFGVHADMGAGWSGTLVLDFAKTGTNGADYLAEAFVAKKVDMDYIKGTLDMGYKKVRFAYEENTSSSKLLTVERSLATRYFVESQKDGGAAGNLGFGSRYTGIFWNGDIKQVDGLSYNLAVTDSQNYNIKPGGTGVDNSLNFWANVGYANKVDVGEGNLGYEFGVNFGYGPGANTATNGSSQHGQIVGVNPYVNLKYAGLTLWTDYLLADVENGKRNIGGDYTHATPQGFNVGAEYRFDIGDLGAIAPTVRYSALFTNGRGVKIGDALNAAPNVDSTSLNSGIYNNAHSIFAGVNWYIKGDNVKLQLGYEWAEFYGSPSSETVFKRAYVDSFRAQIQVLF